MTSPGTRKNVFLATRTYLLPCFRIRADVTVKCGNDESVASLSDGTQAFSDSAAAPVRQHTAAELFGLKPAAPRRPERGSCSCGFLLSRISPIRTFAALTDHTGASKSQ